MIEFLFLGTQKSDHRIIFLISGLLSRTFSKMDTRALTISLPLFTAVSQQVAQ